MLSALETRSAPTVNELLVLWQEPRTRAMLPVGVLSFDGDVYGFRYLPTARSTAGFRPLMGFRDLEKAYTISELFPLFHERVLDPMRPDFERVVESLELDATTATPWEQLIRGGGGTESDTLQVTPMPSGGGSHWRCSALVMGMRYFHGGKVVETPDGTAGGYTPKEYDAVLSDLHEGTVLAVRREVGNEYNTNARLLFHAGSVVGYFPDWLARLATPIGDDADLCAKVTRRNGDAVGWHLRLVVDVEAAEPLVDAQSRLLGALRY